MSYVRGGRARPGAPPSRRRGARAEPRLLRIHGAPGQGLLHRDPAVEVASLGVQVHGGMGYIEETGRGAALPRRRASCRIYEGHHRHPGQRSWSAASCCATGARHRAPHPCRQYARTVDALQAAEARRRCRRCRLALALLHVNLAYRRCRRSSRRWSSWRARGWA